jgi:hypothetical protein
MHKILTPLILFIASLNMGYACLNGQILRLNDGTFLFVDKDIRVPHGHRFNFKKFDQALIRLDSLYKTSNNLDYLSDKGIILIILKKYDQAIQLYLNIEKIQPNRYSTASNIGTAYELVGQNENALKWIEKAIEINPESHDNSEWLHAKILEAKINGEEFYTTNFLLNTDFGSELTPKTTLSKHHLLKLSDVLFFQLNERMSFIKPKDKIVAQLLFDLGNTKFLLGHYFDAKADYKLAKEYGFENPLIDSRAKEIDRLLNQPKPLTVHKTNYDSIIYGILVLVVLTLMALFIYKRRKNLTTL